MKRILLEDLAVTELNSQEMVLENGGGWIEWLITIASDIADDPEGFR